MHPAFLVLMIFGSGLRNRTEVACRSLSRRTDTNDHTGRYSDSWLILPSLLPSPTADQWIYRGSSPVTAAGPFPICHVAHGIPFQALSGTCNLELLKERNVQFILYFRHLPVHPFDVNPILRNARLEASKIINVDRTAFPPQPIKPGADVRLEVLTVADRAGPTADLSHDAAHGLAAGQEHGVDDRGQRFARCSPALQLLGSGAVRSRDETTIASQRFGLGRMV